MAKRFTDTGKWDKKWFRELKPKYKCFWDYLTCKCDMAGIWEVDFEAASFYIKEEISKEEIFDIIKDQIHIISDNKWLIKDFILFQYGVKKLSHTSPIHKKIIGILIKNSLYDSLSHSLPASLSGSLSDSLFPVDENADSKINDDDDLESFGKKQKLGLNEKNNDLGRIGGRVCNTLEEKEKDKDKGKEEEMEMEGYHELQLFVLENLPHVSKIKKQLTIKESNKLVELFGIQDVKDILMRMDNKKDVEKKYNTVYQTCREWCSNNFSNSSNGHSKKKIVDKSTAKQIAENEKLASITPASRKAGWDLED